MEGFGHDVAQKIKSAIRAKLVELDAYVDDELPDYIMVMVANKKSKASMSEDLNLFLNEHTDHFTDWLHDVLNKLHSVKIEGSKTRRLISGSISETKIKPSSSDNDKEAPEAVTTSEAAILEEAAPVNDVNIAEATEPPVSGSTAVTDPSADADLQDEFLAIKAEQEKDDILGAELQEEPAVPDAVVVSPAAPLIRAKPETKVQAVKAEVVATSPQISGSEEQQLKQQPVPIATPSEAPRIIKTRISVTADSPESAPSVKTTTNGVTVSKPTLARHKQTSPASRVLAQSIASRKRKAPTSTLGAVVQHPFPRPDDEEDEYDPRHPIIGTVASVVKVTQRRSSVPPERQANRSLLFKAIEEARKSVLSSTKPSQEIYVNSDSATQLFTRTYLSAMEQHSVADLLPKVIQKSPKISSTSSASFAALRVPRISLPIGPISRQAKQQAKSPAKTPPMSTRSNVRTYKTATSPITYEPMSVDQQEDSISEMKVEMENEEEIKEASDFSPEEVSADCSVVMPPPPPNPPSRPASPKFIITLDGVDADDMFPGYENTALDTSDEALDLLVEDEFELELQNQHHEISYNDDEIYGSDEEMDVADAEEMENGSAKRMKLVQERCRYWPMCRSGVGCQYLHPSTPCKTFPNCKFGNRCVYIHPPCKFDSACSRRHDCPYAHTSRIASSDAPIDSSMAPRRRTFGRLMVGYVPLKRYPPPLTFPLASMTRCRDFPKCTNMDCPFLHPRPCRYGVGCCRLDCIFSHPPLPKRDQLRWKNESLSDDQPMSHISERGFALVKVQKRIATPVTSRSSSHS